MKKLLFLLSLSVCLCPLHAQKTTEFQVINRSGQTIVDYSLELPQSKLKKLPLGNYKAIVDNQEVPVEIITGLKGENQAIIPVAKILPNETKTIQILEGQAIQYPKRTYAELAHKTGGEFGEPEITDRHYWIQYKGDFAWVKPNYLRVPDNFTDHAYYIKYEGPGWESDKVGFRFYLDWRNGIDVFAKRVPGIVLPFVGVDGYENYHHLAVWGMDNQTVGKGLGLGSIAVWDGKKAIRVEKSDSVICYIPADGKIRSQVKTIYYGWNANSVKTTLQSLISIDAGSRASHIELQTDRNLDNIATGIIKDKNAELFTGESGDWAYIATFGKQSLNDDKAGLAVFYRKNQLKQLTEDALNHVIVLKPENGFVDYYFMAAWELDWEKIATKSDFDRCINEVLNRLNFKPIIK
ncbi:MAG: DUF4861 domain-containing protein [Dysgonamonadaceae bacterium]|jgi:hypothetical protein|nr:DUF4861 domain-containing protein [Dysgonamonadaceae bacterium]